MVVTGEANNAAKFIRVLNFKVAIMTDRCLKGVRAVASEMEDSGYAEQLRRLYVGDNSKNNGRENRINNTRMGKVQGEKVVLLLFNSPSTHCRLVYHGV